jgi:hypothetical protein
MAKVDPLTVPLICPKCGKIGNAKREENENPIRTGVLLDRSIETVSEGFHAEGYDLRGNQRIVCDKCNVLIRV